MDIEDLIKLKVKKIIRLLVAGEYRRLEEMNKIGKLSSDELEEAILQYGERLSFPPEEAFDEMDIFKSDNPQNCYEEYFIDIELWTNGCKSDLTLSCEAKVTENKELNVTIYSVHVF